MAVSVPSQHARGSESSATTTIALRWNTGLSSFHAIMAFADWQCGKASERSRMQARPGQKRATRVVVFSRHR